MGKDREPVQDTEQLGCKIVGLEIKRSKTFEPTKTYGNVPQEDIVHWYVDEDSQKIATRTKENILKLIQRDPGQLPCVIDALVVTGTFFESIKDVAPIDEDNWVDGELSSQMVTETVLGIGKAALDYLEKNKEEYAKTLTKKLRKDISSKQIEKFLKKPIPRNK